MTEYRMVNGTTALKLAIAVSGTILVSCAGMWGMISVHEQRPHPNSVTRHEIEMLKDMIQSQHTTIQNEVQSLRRFVESK